MPHFSGLCCCPPSALYLGSRTISVFPGSRWQPPTLFSVSPSWEYSFSCKFKRCGLSICHGQSFVLRALGSIIQQERLREYTCAAAIPSAWSTLSSGELLLILQNPAPNMPALESLSWMLSKVELLAMSSLFAQRISFYWSILMLFCNCLCIVPWKWRTFWH